MDFLFDFLAKSLAFFYDLWPSFGMAIVLFTIAIYLLLSPLTIKSTRSMIAMQRVQPELKKLQQEHKNDKEALQREMMAFYQANNINPFSSCLPLLLQMPIFFVLFQVLNGLTRKETIDGVVTFAPKYLDHESALFRALDRSNEMVSWGLDLARSASTVLTKDGIIDALPFLVLVALTALTTWYQQRQVAGRNPNAQANPQQQMMTRVMPFIFLPISYTLPAGVVVYFVVSAMVRIGQQALVTRLEFPEGKPAAPPKSPKQPKPKPAPPAPPSTPGAPAPTARTGGGKNRAKNRKRKRR